MFLHLLIRDQESAGLLVCQVTMRRYRSHMRKILFKESLFFLKKFLNLSHQIYVHKVVCSCISLPALIYYDNCQK